MKNTLILLPVIAGVIVAGYFLYLDYHPAPTTEEQQVQREAIGEVISVENNVKRQYGNEVLWNGIESKNPVFNKDSIRTGKDSSATIKLKDSSIIEVAENSLIVLDKSQENLSINFKAGDITAKNSSKDLAIKVKASAITGEGADLKVSMNDSGRLSVEVAKGKAFITDKDKKKTEINQSEQAGLTDSGVSEVNKIAVVLKSPENKTVIQSNSGDTRQPFTWEVTRSDLKQEQFELSKSLAFRPETTKSFKAHQAITAELTPGVSYWRVGWQDKDKMMYTSARQITVGQDKRIELVYPESDTHFDLDPAEDNVGLEWRSDLRPKVFVVEVSSTSDFKHIVFTRPQTEMKAEVKNLSSNSYFWHVKAFGEKNDELSTSVTHTFTIKVKLPKFPELVKPAESAVWDTREPVEFSWKKWEKAKDYRVVISTDPNQKEIVKTTSTEGTLFKWRWDTQDTYYWSVRAMGQQANAVGQSEIRRVVIRPKNRGPVFNLINPKDKAEVLRGNVQDPEPILFQWQVLRHPLPGPVHLWLSKNEDFKDATRDEVTDKLSLEKKIKESATYYWKLTSESADKHNLEVSDVMSFNLKLSNAYNPPTLIEPANKENIETPDPDQPGPVKFSWNPVKDATQYHLVVERVDSKTNEHVAVIDRLVKEGTFTSSPLQVGSYSWHLSAMDPQGQEGTPSASYTFNLVAPELVAPPKLNVPVIK